MKKFAVILMSIVMVAVFSFAASAAPGKGGPDWCFGVVVDGVCQGGPGTF